LYIEDLYLDHRPICNISQSNSQRPFTKIAHKEVYHAVVSSQPSLSAKGKTLLITRATQGISYAIATTYAAAGAANAIITGLNSGRQVEAKKTLEHEYPATNVYTFATSVDDKAATASLFSDISNTHSPNRFLAPTTDLDHCWYT